MTWQAFETLPSSAARFNSPSLFLMMRALRCSMVGLPFHLLGFDRASQPLSKRVTLPFATQQCQIRSELLQLMRAKVFPLSSINLTNRELVNSQFTFSFVKIYPMLRCILLYANGITCQTCHASIAKK